MSRKIVGHMICDHCHGLGKIHKSVPCFVCNGLGKIHVDSIMIKNYEVYHRKLRGEG